jgi:hypothetical protein
LQRDPAPAELSISHKGELGVVCIVEVCPRIEQGDDLIRAPRLRRLAGLRLADPQPPAVSSGSLEIHHLLTALHAHHCGIRARHEVESVPERARLLERDPADRIDTTQLWLLTP